MRAALPACLLLLAACGGEPDAPAPPSAEEQQVLADAAEMLPAEETAEAPDTPNPSE